jgi:hypothetical protein
MSFTAPDLLAHTYENWRFVLKLIFGKSKWEMWDDPLKHSISSKLVGNFDYIHFFTKSKEEFNRTFPKLKKHLKENGMLWVSWLKGKQGGTDLTLQKVIKLGYDFGLIESKTSSINKIWSALKFTFPKKTRNTIIALGS